MMKKIEKSKALSILSKLINDSVRIKNMRYDQPECQEWENKVETAITNIFDDEHLNRYNEKFSAKVYSSWGDNDSLCQKNHYEDVNTAVSFLKSLIDEMENFWGDGEDDTINDCANFTEIIRIINRFHFVVNQLRQRHDERESLDVTDEYDVQDLFHALLRLYFDDIRAEEWTPSYAGSSSRMDFLIPDLELAIEIKMTRKGLATKETGEQLAIDKDYYRSHPTVKHLICFVYDPEGRIKNPRGFERDLHQDSPLKTDVYVRP